MANRGDDARVAYPLFQTGCGGSIPASPLQVSDLIFEPCARGFAGNLNRLWHSRLPEIVEEMASHAFMARNGDFTYAVAIWSNPVARMLPTHWRELRRMACSPEMPQNGSSAFLAWMVRWFLKNEPSVETLISYQDTDVHKGTIYKAAGWKIANRTREGDSWNKPSRERKNMNGDETIASMKIRWQIDLA